MDERFEGVGITPRQLQPGTAVMVPVGQANALVNGQPCVIAWAVVKGPAGADAAAVFTDPKQMYWLDVYMIPGGPPLPQMYQADTILGIPALGLAMNGAPPPNYTVQIT